MEKLKKTDCATIKAEHLKNILFLNLSRKEIAFIEAKDFSELISLKRLDLHNNDIVSLPSGVFDTLISLEVLNLSHNNISILPLGIFDKLTVLEILHINSYHLTSLPPGIFSKLIKLHTLVIDFSSGISEEEKSRIEQELTDKGGVKNGEETWLFQPRSSN